MTFIPQPASGYQPPATNLDLGVVIQSNAHAGASSVQSCINAKIAGLRVRIQPYQVVQAYENMTQFFMQQAQAMQIAMQPNGLAAMTGMQPQPQQVLPTIEQVVEAKTTAVESAVSEHPEILKRIAEKHGYTAPKQ